MLAPSPRAMRLTVVVMSLSLLAARLRDSSGGPDASAGDVWCRNNEFDRHPVTRTWTNGDKSVTPRVLVVEDEPHIRELVCLHLGLEGYACEGLADGVSALNCTESERLVVLVLDVMNPRIDGLAL